MSNEAARRNCSQAVTLAIVFTAPGVRLALCEGTGSVKISHVRDSCKFWQFNKLFCCSDDGLENLTYKNLVPWDFLFFYWTYINDIKAATFGGDIYTYGYKNHIFYMLYIYLYTKTLVNEFLHFLHMLFHLILSRKKLPFWPELQLKVLSKDFYWRKSHYVATW